ncbi:MAG: YfiR family protein [Bacteroidetes bacterium]|nr:YfiR family protein [Bacteroidota bacterium]
MNRFFKIAFVGLIGFMSLGIQAADDTPSKIKATFIYNFTKYIEWPASYKQGNFIIGIVGTTPLLKDLSNMAATKKAGAQPFEIQSFPNVNAIGKCHLLFVAADNASNIKEISSKMKGFSTLIVAERPGCAKQGAAINFVIMENKQRFELNKANAEKYNLKIGSSLAGLAILVE